MALTVPLYGDIERTEFTIPLGVLLSVGLVCSFWTFVTQVLTLAEVQRFSILSAIASMAILTIPALLLLYLLARSVGG